MTGHPAEAHLFIVMGGRGDLMHRKLLPALYRLYLNGQFPAPSKIIGAGRSAGENDEYQEWAIQALVEAGHTQDEALERWVRESCFYVSVGGELGYQALKNELEDLEEQHGLPGNRVIYFSMPPGAFPSTLEALHAQGLNQSKGWTRLVVEKPFGYDLSSAQKLNALVHQYFSESQVYRIDHYLGKESVQNLLVFRFANAMFEPLWNRDRIERVEITVAESLGLEGRAGYYDKSGALRDMIQNHLTQVLALTAMEAPATFQSEAIRDEKVKVLKAIRPIKPSDVVLGQYGRGGTDGWPMAGYHDEADVPPTSTTETFVALRLEVANWRWQGVPFYLRTGKRLPRRTSQIVVTFRQPPVALFPHTCAPNQLVITLQPDEGFDIRFLSKAPGEGFEVEEQKLTFRYKDVHGALPEAYETLLLDVMNGDPTLFVRSDEVEAAWALYTPVFSFERQIHSYPAGSWGPKAANHLLPEGVNEWGTR
ncbi:MAG TPA: glucose-6-phosphate dehydrogenase [Symbiobacteriaceae bacterium]|nr:glucose-6-phosphate dehydrogenase [Symbiobacteriaceae bacterium]